MISSEEEEEVFSLLFSRFSLESSQISSHSPKKKNKREKEKRGKNFSPFDFSLFVDRFDTNNFNNNNNNNNNKKKKKKKKKKTKEHI